MKKKILLILTEFPPGIGGMQTHAILLSKYLAHDGADIKVFTYRPNRSKQDFLQTDKIFDFPVHRVLSRISYYFSLELLVKEVKSFQPDIIYSSTIFYGILEELTGVKTFCRCVGNDVMRPWIVYPFKFASNIGNKAK